jgi:hypothetical protein
MMVTTTMMVMMAMTMMMKMSADCRSYRVVVEGEAVEMVWIPS